MKNCIEETNFTNYKLKHYEDLEQKGLLLELPCKLQDTVYGYCRRLHKVIPFAVTKMYFDYNSDKKLELFIEGESIINSSSKPITSIPFTKKYPTYTITYEPQSDMFLITNERCFYYEYNKEFQDKKEAFNYFKNNYLEFIKIRNVSQQIAGQPISSKITIALNNYEYVSYYCSDKELKKMIPDIKKEVEEIKKQNNKNKPDFCEDDFDMVF